MVPTEIYHELIAIGDKGILNYMPKLSILFPPNGSNAYSLYHNDLSAQFDSEDLINLFRGLVICEKELKWHCGSTTPAAHLYQDIKNRGLDQDYSLADWAFQYSDNEYVPFGFIRHGERTAYEYIQWREDYHNRIIQEQIDKEGRKKRKLEGARKIQEEKRNIDNANRELYAQIQKLTPEKQVETILSDSEHNILFYLPIINSLIDSSSVSQTILKPIVDRLQTLKPTPTNKKLINLILSKV